MSLTLFLSKECVPIIMKYEVYLSLERGSSCEKRGGKMLSLARL